MTAVSIRALTEFMDAGGNVIVVADERLPGNSCVKACQLTLLANMLACFHRSPHLILAFLLTD